jgi:hypothetical protein
VLTPHIMACRPKTRTSRHDADRVDARVAGDPVRPAAIRAAVDAAAERLPGGSSVSVMVPHPGGHPPTGSA